MVRKGLNIEKPISIKRLDYLLEKLDSFLHTCLRPNEMLELHVILSDLHTQERTKERGMVTSRFGTDDELEAYPKNAK